MTYEYAYRPVKREVPHPAGATVEYYSVEKMVVGENIAIDMNLMLKTELEALEWISRHS